MEKVWFVFFEGKREGPKTKEELKIDRRLTPDTLVWKEGLSDWKKIREIAELNDLFEEKKEDDDTLDENSQDLKKVPTESELAIDMRLEPPYFIWLIIALTTIVYMVLNLYVK